MLEEIEELQKQSDMIQERINRLREVVSKTENTTFPKEGDEYWAICGDGRAKRYKWVNDALDNKAKDFGNCFQTQEEAELAVQKLKAFRRLRDKGFKFDGYEIEVQYQGGARIKLDAVIEGELCTLDLDLLFGGEE